MKFEHFLEAASSETQDAWTRHFKKKNDQQEALEAKKKAEKEKRLKSQSNKARLSDD